MRANQSISTAFGVEPADDVHLGQLVGELSQNLLHGHLVGVIVAGLRGEVAERAVQHTEIRRVDLAVHDEENRFAGLGAFDVIRHLAERGDVPRSQDGESIVSPEPATSQYFLPDRYEGGVLKDDVLDGSCTHSRIIVKKRLNLPVGG